MADVSGYVQLKVYAPVTLEMLALNSTPAVFGHHVFGVAVIEAGVFGAPLIAVQRVLLVPHALDALTQTCPVVKAPKSIVTALFPLPLTVPGAVQL